MNVNQYINKIAKEIKCSGAKKKEIKKQLLSDIELRQQQGEKAEDIFLQMGSVREIADSFNENLSEKEKKSYSRMKMWKRLLEIAAVLIVLIAISLYWFVPRNVDIEKSAYFDKTRVKEAVINTVELLDTGDYDLVLEDAVDRMKTEEVKEALMGAKAQIAEDWGAPLSYGNAYIAEMVQQGHHFAIGQITVQYENVSVTYTITYDEDMKLAGLYMR